MVTDAKSRYIVVFEQNHKKILSWFGDDYDLLRDNAIRFVNAETLNTTANLLDNQSGQMVYKVQKTPHLQTQVSDEDINFNSLNSKLGIKIFVALAPIIANQQYGIDEEEMIYFALDIYQSIKKLHAENHEIEEFIMLSVASIKLQLERDKCMSSNNLVLQ